MTSAAGLLSGTTDGSFTSAGATTSAGAVSSVGVSSIAKKYQIINILNVYLLNISEEMHY